MVIEVGGILTHGDNSTSHDYELDFQMENLDLQLEVL